jgi:aldose 1-epimerase
VAGVGASLRQLTWQGRDLVVPFNADEVRPAFRGAVLAPWPNRVVDGRYRFNGVEHELALTEPARGHALHGLVVWQDFEPVRQEPEAVTLAATVPAQAGYPYRLALEVSYALSEQGLAISLAATNTGPHPAPYGASVHPYLRAGPGTVDDWVLELPAASVLTVTPDRLVPVEVRPVTDQANQFDFRRPRPIADAFLDHAFTDLSAGPDGRFQAKLTDVNGAGVVMSWDVDCPWVQVHTADRPQPEPGRIGLAVEPMTCPPDAFNSGQDLRVLPSGGSTSTAWHLAGV